MKVHPEKDLEYYKSLWDLSSIDLLQETPRGFVYKAFTNNRPAVLKIAKPLGLEHERGAAAFLKACPETIAVEIYEQDELATLMEHLPGPTLTEDVKNGNDDAATTIIAQIAAKIQTVPVPENHSFIGLREWFRALLERAEKRNGPHWKLFETAAGLAKDLLDDTPREVLLHGDLHHDNIIRDRQGRYKMIDPKGLIGDPAYEVANAFRNPDIAELVTKERIMRQASIFSDIMGIDKTRILAFGFVHAAISPLWSEQDGETDNGAINIAQIFYENGLYE